MSLDKRLRSRRRSIVLIESGIRGGVSVEIRPRQTQGPFAYGHSEDRFFRFQWPEGVIDYYAPPGVRRAVEGRALALAVKYARSLQGIGEIHHFESGRGWFGGPP
jgi:hypothetical protein